MLNLACHPCPGSAAIPFLFDEERLPERFLAGYQEGRIPPPAEEARPVLRAMIADQLDRLRERQAFLQDHIDGPDRAEAPDRAVILKDKDEARLFLRYHAEARSTFHRAYAALIKAIDRRHEQEAGSDQENPPNEPESTQESASNSIAETSSVETPCADLAPPADPVAGPVAPAPEGSDTISRNEAKPAVKASQASDESKTSDETRGVVRVPATGPKAGCARPDRPEEATPRAEGPVPTERRADEGGDFVPIAILDPVS
jgi:hypothetical protein